MKYLLLSRGKVTVVSDEDYERTSKYKWSYDGRYARGKVGDKMKQLHRFILAPPQGMEVDHINGDKLDNRRENLRICTSSQNRANIKMNPRNTSGAKGVVARQRKESISWEASVTFKGKRVYRHFKSKEEAILFRDKLAQEMHGEFASLIKKP